MSRLGSLRGQFTCPPVPPSSDSCPVHMDGPISSFTPFSDVSRPQEILSSSESLDMHSLKLIGWLYVVETELVKMNLNLGNSNVFVNNKIHFAEYR